MKVDNWHWKCIFKGLSHRVCRKQDGSSSIKDRLFKNKNAKGILFSSSTWSKTGEKLFRGLKSSLFSLTPPPGAAARQVAASCRSRIHRSVLLRAAVLNPANNNRSSNHPRKCDSKRILPLFTNLDFSVRTPNGFPSA